MLRPLPALVGACALMSLACGADPLADDAASYVVAMQPTLEENAELANEFIQVAAAIHQREIDDEGIIERWDATIVPKANDLHATVDDIQPATPELQGPHEELVASWADRADAYEEMKAAYESNDDAKFKAAQEKNVNAKLAEERYFRDVNAVLSGYGYRLDQFPAGN